MFCMLGYYNEIGHDILPVLKEATSLTFERSINLLENVTSSNMSQLLDAAVSAIQTEYAIPRCPLFRGVRYLEVSAIFRGVRYSEVFAIQRSFAIQRCAIFRDVRYSEVSAIQRCPLVRGVRYSEVSASQTFSYKVLH